MAVVSLTAGARLGALGASGWGPLEACQGAEVAPEEDGRAERATEVSVAPWAEEASVETAEPQAAKEGGSMERAEPRAQEGSDSGAEGLMAGAARMGAMLVRGGSEAFGVALREAVRGAVSAAGEDCPGVWAVPEAEETARAARGALEGSELLEQQAP